MNNSSTTNGRTTHNSGQAMRGPRKEHHVTASSNAAALVTSLNRAFCGKCDFPVLSRIVDRQSSPELMKIREKVKEIPQIEFQTILEFNHHIQTNNARLQNYRREKFLNRAFVLNEPAFKRAEEVQSIFDWSEERKNNFGVCGQQFIGRHTTAILQRDFWINGEANKVNNKIAAIHVLREHTEYWQGFWDAIKDNISPEFSAAGGNVLEPLLVLANWVAELTASGLVYNQSWEREKFLEVLDTWEDMLTKDYEMIMATSDELRSYTKFMSDSMALWAAEVGFIWDMKSMNHNMGSGSGRIKLYEACLQDLKTVERMFSLTIQPFEEALSHIHPFYGSGISVPRTTSDFCEHVPTISVLLKKLLTAKGIIADGQEEQFEENVYCLARIIYGRLQTIQELCAQWSKSIDPGELEKFIQKGNLDFVRGTDRVIQVIKSMLQTETQDSKEKQALKKRTEWDRRYKNWSWNDRPLVTSASACDVLEDLETIIDVVYCLSVSTGTGTNMMSIGRTAEVRRSNVEFNHSNPLLKEFFEVLEAEIQRGSSEFPEKKEKQTPVTETKKSRGGLFKRQWKKWWGAKPTAPNPMEELGLA